MDELTRLAKLLAKQTANADETRGKLYAAIRAALAEGKSQSEIARATNYTREMIRRITTAKD